MTPNELLKCGMARIDEGITVIEPNWLARVSRDSGCVGGSWVPVGWVFPLALRCSGLTGESRGFVAWCRSRN